MQVERQTSLGWRPPLRASMQAVMQHAGGAHMRLNHVTLMVSSLRPLKDRWQSIRSAMTYLLLGGLILHAFVGVLGEGSTPTFNPKLGTSKGGTRLKVQVGGHLNFLLEHFLKINSGDPITAAHVVAIKKDTVEAEFVMPALVSTKKSVVKLSYSQYGDDYIDLGEFVYYDGDQWATTALRATDEAGVWSLDSSIFPHKYAFGLVGMHFTPTCKYKGGLDTQAQYPIPFEYARRVDANLTVCCPIKSPSHITHISLNKQDFVGVKDLQRHVKHVEHISLAVESNGHNETGRNLGSNSPVCTITDTGMGLSILVMFPTPTNPGPVNVSTDLAGSFSGIGGPMAYVVSVIVGSPGTYKLTSIIPSCAGVNPPVAFNVSGPPSPQYSFISSTFATDGYPPGSSVSFNITSADGQGIIPTGLLGGPFPFNVTLTQTSNVVGNNLSFPVPFIAVPQMNGIWQITCTPSRFLPTKGYVTLNGVPIVNNMFTFTLKPLSASAAATKFMVYPNSSLPAGPSMLSIDAADSLPKYMLIHQITAQVLDPTGIVLINSLCDLNRATVGCFFPIFLRKAGTYSVNVTIDYGTVLSPVTQVVVMPGMVSGLMSTMTLEGVISNNTQKTAGDTVTALLTLQDAYGNAGNTAYAYGGWNTTVAVVLTCDRGSYVNMNVVSGAGSTNASTKVTTAGYYVASAFIGSTGNSLQGSGKYGFYVNPNTANITGWTGNIMVGEMIAGVFTPVVVALIDAFGNVIDGSMLRGTPPVTVNLGGQNFSAQAVGRTFQLLPGLNQTVAKSGIIITANYGSAQLATFNATCLPGPADILVSTITTSATNFTVGTNGTLTLNLLDSFGNVVTSTTNLDTFAGAVLVKDDTMGATNLDLLLGPGGLSNPCKFSFAAPTVAGHYYARIPIGSKIITTQAIITVIPGDPVGAKFGVTGPGGLEAQPGTNFTMFITARDLYNNIWQGDGTKLGVSITAGSFRVDPADQSITPDALRGFRLTFKTPPTTGPCTISVKGFASDITSTVMTMRIVAGELRQVAVEELRQGVVNQLSSFFLVAQDAGGFRRDDPSLPPDRFYIRLCKNVTCGRATVNDRHTSGGRYRVTWGAPSIGEYQVQFWSPSGLPSPLTNLTVVSSAGTSKVMYYPRCNGVPPTVATCPQYYGAVAGQVASFNLSSNNEPPGAPPTSISTGGNLPAISMTGGRIISLIDQGDGTYTVSYMATSVPAALNVNNGVPSTIPLTITPGLTAAFRCTFQLDAALVPVLAAGSSITGEFTANDAMGNQQDYSQYPPESDKFMLVARNKDTGEMTVAAVSFSGAGVGSFSTNLTLIWTGTYNLQASLNEVPIQLLGADGKVPGSSGFRVTPGPPDIGSMVYPPDSMQLTTTAGASGTLMLYSINDIYGNPIPKSLLNCSAKVIDERGYDPPMTCVIGDNYITFTYANLSTAGSNYTFLYSVISPGGEVDLSNPLFIAPTDPWPPSCSVLTPSPVITQVGSKTVLTILCKDKFGNLCTGDRSGQFIVSVGKVGGLPNSPIIAASTVQSNVTGQILAYFYLKQSGNFTASVRFNDMGDPMIGGPITIISSPADTSVNLTFAYLASSPRKLVTDTLPARVVAGDSNVVKVVGVDVNGNLQDRSKCSSSNLPTITLSTDDVGFDGQGGGVAPLVTSPIAALSSSDPGCVFIFNFTATAVYKTSSPLMPANYNLRIQWTGGATSTPSDIAGSPFNLQVDPGTLDIPSSVVQLQARAAGVTGLSTTFLLSTRDRFGNQPFYNQTLNVSAVVAPAGSFKVSKRRLLELGDPKNLNSSNAETVQALDFWGDFESAPLMTPIVTNNLDTTYSISFTVIKSGAYDILIYMNGMILQPNPSTPPTISSYIVVPGIPDITRLKPLGLGISDDKMVPVGSTLNFSINLCDNFGNPVNMVGKADLLNKYITGISAQSVVNIQGAIGNNTISLSPVNLTGGTFSTANGVIVYSCTPTVAGLMNIALAYTDATSSKVVRSVLGPFHATIVPNGGSNPALFSVFGPGVMAALECEDKDTCAMNTMYVLIRDTYNNTLYPDKFLCASFSLGGWNASIMLSYSGKPAFDNYCAISYKVLPVNTTRNVNFNVSYNTGSSQLPIPALRQWTTVDQSGYSFTVPVLTDTQDPEPNNCLAFGDLGGMMMAGDAGHIIVQLVDSNGLAIQTSLSSGGDYVRLVITPVSSNDPNYNPPLAPTVSSTDNGDGTFSLEYDTAKSGNFTILIMVGLTDKPLGGKTDGYPLQVVAAPTVIERTVVTMIANATTNRAGQDWVQIEVQAVDAYDNLQDYVLAPTDGFQADILQPDNTLAMVALNRTWQLGDNGMMYALWVLNFLPLQASPESTYTFTIIWRNDTNEISVPSSAMIVPTIPGPPSSVNMKVTGSGTSAANVGAYASIMITLFDSLDNPISAIQDIADANISAALTLGKFVNQTVANCSISSNPPGVLCRYMVTIPGWYILNIYSNDLRLKALGVEVGHGSINGANCLAFGDGVGTTGIPLFPGTPTTFSIQTFDHQNNSVPQNKAYFEVRGENLNQSGTIVPKDGYPAYISDNFYQVQYTPVKAGFYNVFVQRASVNILGSPFQVEVRVGPVASNCILDAASLDPCAVGGTKNITLLSRDAFGNVRIDEQDVFHIFKTVDGFPLESTADIMAPVGSGAYSYGFDCINDTLVQITYDAVLVYSGKIGTVVGPADPSQCTMALDTAVINAGDTGKGLIVTRDIGGHPLFVGGLNIKVTYWTVSGNNDTMTVIDNGDGTYGVSYQILVSGIYFVIAQLGGQTFYSETLLVLPSTPSAAQTVVTIDSNGYTVNVEGSFTVQIFDEHQNNVTDSGALDTTSLSLFYVSSDVPARTAFYPAANLAIDFSSDTYIYTITFTPTLPGNVFINMKVGGEGVLNFGTPYSAPVAPLPPSPANFEVWGPGIEAGAIAGETTFFYVRVRDAAGTIILTEPPDSFDAKISPASLVPSGPSFSFAGNGVMQFSYMAIQPSSKLLVSASYGGARIQNPVNLQVKDVANSIDVTQTVVLGPDGIQISTSVPLVYSVGTSDNDLTFTIQPHDNEGFIITNPNINDSLPVFFVTVAGGGIPMMTVQTDPSSWTFEFSIPFTTVCTSMFVAVQSNANGPLTDVKNSGFTIIWVPSSSSPSNIVIVQSPLNTVTPTQVVAGQTITITVQAYDMFNNPQIYNIQSPDVFTATLNSYPSGDVVGNPATGLNNGDLTFDLILTVMSVGAYNVTVFLNGEQAALLPLVVVTNDLDLVAGIGMITSMVDPLVVTQETVFVLSASDIYGNPVTDPGNMYVVLQNHYTGANYSASVLASNDTVGQFQVSIMPTKSGHYSIMVGDGKARSGGLACDLQEIDVRPGPVSLNLTNTSIPIGVYKAGRQASFSIIAMDAYGNPNYTIPQVSITPADTPAYATSVESPCSSAALQDAAAGQNCHPANPPYTALVTFTPLYPGMLNISISWDTDNGIYYENIEVLPGTRPIALSAKLSRNLGSVVVSFDIPTDAGYESFTGLNGPHLGWQRCNNTLDQSVMDKIGIGPICNFRDSTTMTIQLGYNATIMPADSGVGDNITLLGGIYNQDDTSAPMIGWVPLGITDYTPPPVAQLVGPSITGVCDNLTLDASGSSGAAGRVLTYSFYVRGTGDPDKLAAVASLLDSIPSQMVVTIGPGILDPDQTYIFEVIVTNYLGMWDSATLTVQTVRAAVPQVSIRDNQKLIEVNRWESIELEAHARLSYGYTLQTDGVCSQGPRTKKKTLKFSAPSPLLYEWTQTGASVLDQDAVGWNARSLNIPGSLLKPGLIYNFQVKCWPAGSPQLSSTASVALHATHSPLSVRIVGGDRAANASEDLYLKASVYDPDDSVDFNIDQPHPYEFSWKCDKLNLGSYFEANIYPDVAGAIKCTLLIPSSLLTDGATYVFTVTVARAPYTDKSRYSATATATITASNAAMNIIATVNNGAEVLAYGMSSSRMLKVMCSPGLGTYKWLIQSGADQRQKSEMGVVMIDESTMKINPLTLVAGAVYNFTCMATNALTTGVASVLVTTLPEPSGGNVELRASPAAQHIAGSTRYSIRTYGWTPGGDMIGPLKYEFRYVILDTKGAVTKEVIVRPVSSVNKVTDVFVMAGTVVFRVYVMNPGPMRFMPNDAPYGTLFEFEPIVVKKGHRRRLLGLPSAVTNFYHYAKKGMYYSSLVAMDAYNTQTFTKQSGGCGGGGNKKVIRDMMQTIAFNDPQYPAASQGNAIQSGSGPYIALLTASVYSKLIGRPMNLNFDDFKTALHIFLEKLDKVATYGVKVPTNVGTPYMAFLDAGDMFVKVVKMKCFKSGNQAQALMDRVSIIPIWLAEMVYHDDAFESPTVVEHTMFTVGALGFKLPQNPYNAQGGPVYLSGQMGSFFATITVNKGNGVEFGLSAACFNKFSPLSSAGTTSLNRDKRLVKLMQVCDFSILGLTATDFFEITVTGSFTNLKKLGKGFAYKAVQVDMYGMADFGLLQNVVSTLNGVSFDFVGPYSRVCLVKLKMDKSFVPVGWQGVHEKFKPPKNRFITPEREGVRYEKSSLVVHAFELKAAGANSQQQTRGVGRFVLVSFVVVTILQWF